MSEEDEDYNGWTNRETWACALHINNDENLYRRYLAISTELARSVRETHDGDWKQELFFVTCRLFEDQLINDFEIGTYDNPTGVGHTVVPKYISLAIADIGSTWRINTSQIARMLTDMGIEALEQEE